MELQDYLTILRKRWLSIALITLVAVAAAIGASLAMTPTYQATAQLYVSVQSQDSTADLLQGSNYSRQQVTSYVQLVTSPKVLGPVVDKLKLAERVEDLAGSVAADSPLNTSLINITVTDTDPALAAAKANAISDQFRGFVAQLETPVGGGVSKVNVSVVRDAVAPEAPSSPKKKLNVALGLLVGLALGVGIAVLREVLDTRVRGPQDVTRVTDTSIVGTITFDSEASDHPLIVQSDPHSARAEAMRRLRTNVQFLNIGDRPQSIVVTSSVPGEGKSTTTINLAIALADSGMRVALVDADLRRPSVAKYMQLEGGVGLTTVLIGRARAEDVIQPWGNGYLHVLPAGQIPPNPSELLGSFAMANVLEYLTSNYDMVLVDTPPLLPVTDAAVLSKLTGGALVVVGVDRLHRNQLGEALGALETVDARVLGIVLNRQRRQQADAYAYYEYAAADGTTRRRRKTTAPASQPLGSASRKGAARRTAAESAPEGVATLWGGDGQTAEPAASPATDGHRWPGETFTEAQTRGAVTPPRDEPHVPERRSVL